MSVRLVLLGLLHDRPLYGYEIKQIIEEHMGDWTSIAFGSIYFALDKLSSEGFVEKVSNEQHGNRPSRSVYQITPAGNTEFLRMLRETWQTVKQEYYEIDICLFFLDRLSMDEVRTYLNTRLDKLKKALQHLETHETEQFQDPQVPPQAKAIFNHTRLHLKSEVEWTLEVLATLKS